MLAACSSNPELRSERRRERRPPSPVESPNAGIDRNTLTGSELIVASSFEKPVCGSFYSPGPGCEFGIQSEIKPVETRCRTGEKCLRFQRFLPRRGQHIHVGRSVALPSAHGFIGAAHRVPELPLQPGGYIQLMQVTPGDGNVDGSVVEVRVYDDRRLGLSTYRGQEVALTSTRVPVDEWFYVIVEVDYGSAATQRMWVYDDRDKLMERVALTADTTGDVCCRSRQTIGGTISTSAPAYTYADDFYVAAENLGPLHIDAEGQPIE